MIKIFKESNSLIKVWNWKDEIYNEVKDLSINEMINKINDMASRVGKNWKSIKSDSREHGVQQRTNASSKKRLRE
jgi:hypothetical protein